ncbi:hypothetical protein DH2020_040188 [Rehmannia glutinosa]|uniref:Scarecrow-like protein n=1 Tax=Rehmannia glutinosa TaxID=99300 RepID=A0ABR0UUX3_REHGL
MNSRFNSSNRLHLGNQSMPEFSNPKLGNEPRFEITYPDQKLVNGHRKEQSIGGAHLLQNQPFSNGVVSSSFVGIEDDCDFSDGVLRYIDQMLMEEEMEDKTHMLQESLDFQAKERSFYEVLGKKYPPSPQQESALIDDYSYVNRHNSTTSSSDGSGYLIDVVDPSWRSYDTTFNFSNSFIGSSNNLDTDLEEERDSKLRAVYPESNVPVEEFDDVLLHTLGEPEKKFAAYRTELQNAASKGMQQSGQLKGSSGAKGREPEKEVIDLRSLLINCAQAVAADDRRAANELLKQIRRHSSPFGDGNQRLAHYFADGLEARLAGTGSQIHKALVNKRTTASDYLKAYYTYLASSPFTKISNFASNKSITIKLGKAARVHIIDFGILYGFQWPTFIQRVAERKGGPPKLRITGIDFPQPGFRPAERIEDTGRRLARYAKRSMSRLSIMLLRRNGKPSKSRTLKSRRANL